MTLPVADGFASVKIGDIVQASLKTKEASEARKRHAVADGALKRFWEAQEAGPTSLTTREAVALAGTLYTAFTSVLADDPGPPERWEKALRLNAKARAGELGLGLAIGKEANQRASMEDRFGGFADAVLAREGLVVDQKSRDLLLSTIASAMDDASAKLTRNARFDYSPDVAALKYPAWESRSGAEPSGDAKAERITVVELFGRWAAYNADKKAAGTIKRYRGSLQSLVQFAKDRDVRSLTPDDLYAWAEHRRDAEGVSPQSINKNDFVAASAVLYQPSLIRTHEPRRAGRWT
ncbi:site-specific integrase [Methylobacterium durans]|uniref:site-specific integrase n=1 Tax=Methylobacterium durans TaxID=2202825 RepID=UPI0013A53312|nr:site-specific integrase [Methylobacterium durans]